MKPFIALLVIVCVVATSVLPLPVERTAAADESCPDDGSLCAMLTLLPDLLNDPSGSYDQVYYDNYAEHLRRFGFTAPTSFEGEDWDRFVAASFDFAGAGDHLQFVKYWEQQMGYSPFLIDQVIALQHLPGSITLLRGRFDRPSVEAFWSASGYTPNTVNGEVFWKLRGDNQQNLRQAPLLSSPRYNYAIFVRENVIAYSSTALGINATVQAASGHAPTLATNEAVAPLLAHVPNDLASAVLGRGAQFGSASTWMMFGVTPGGPARTNPRTGTPVSLPADTPLRHAYAALLYGPGVDVEQRATAISSAFLSGNVGTTERPYTEFFQDLSVTVDAHHQVVAVDYASQPTNQAGLFSFLLNDDLGFLM